MVGVYWISSTLLILTVTAIVAERAGYKGQPILSINGVNVPSCSNDSSDQPHRQDYQVRLLRYLLNRPPHEKLARPVRHGSGTLNITLKMSLYQIVNVDEPSESVAINVWIEQIWKDELLAWNPEDYGNLTSMVIPVYSIWMPDTYLYNGLVMKREESERLSNMEVYMNYSEDPKRAVVVFRHPTIYTFSCKMNVKYFPFDTQNCSLVFGSWVHDTTFIDYYSPNDVDLTNVIYNKTLPCNGQVFLTNLIQPYVENEAWSIITFKSYRHVVKYKCCPHPYTNIQFHLIMSRRPLYILVNLVVPILLITLVSLIGFFSPDSVQVERGEKVTLGINTLLAMSVMLLSVTDKMPTTSNFIPLMGLFFLMQITLISVATVTTTFVILLQRNNRGGEPVPRFCRKFLFNFVAPIVSINAKRALANQSKKCFKRTAGAYSNAISPDESTRMFYSNLPMYVSTSHASALDKPPRSSPTFPNILPRGSHPVGLKHSPTSEEDRRHYRMPALTRSLHEKLSDISNGIVCAERDLQEGGVHSDRAAKLAFYRFEWDLAATILEKFLLYLFITILCIGTGVMLSIGWLDQQKFAKFAKGSTVSNEL